MVIQTENKLLEAPLITNFASNTSYGRFSSVDPLSSEAPGLTPYRYAMNNPTRMIDPNGMFEDYYLNLQSGEVEYHEGSEDRFDEGLVHLAGDDATVGDIESALAERNYEYTKDPNTPGGFKVNSEKQYKAWVSMQIFCPDNVGIILTLALGTGGKEISKAGGGGQPAYTSYKKGPSLWPAAEGGEKVINGITYTEHALERMQPSGTVMKGSGVVSRGVPVSVVENAIKYGNVTPGNSAAEVVRTFENVRVITNPTGTRVISVIKLGH